MTSIISTASPPATRRSIPTNILRSVKRPAWPSSAARRPRGLVDPARIALALRVPEGVCSFTTLRNLALAKLAAEPAIEIRTGHAVTGGRLLAGGAKELTIAASDGTRTESYDFVINATYAHYNSFCQWFDFSAPQLPVQSAGTQYHRAAPAQRGSAVTIMDGVFPSMIPMGGTPYHLLAHVTASQLVRESSRHPQPLLSRLSAIESNWSGVLEGLHRLPADPAPRPLREIALRRPRGRCRCRRDRTRA